MRVLEEGLVEIFGYNNAQSKKNFSHSVRIRFLRNYTLEGIVPFLSHYCYQSDLKPEISIGGYGSYISELHAPEDTKSDIIVFSLIEQPFFQRYLHGDFDTSAIINDLKTAFTLLKNASSIVILNTFILPVNPEFGVSNLGSNTDKTKHIATVNQFITNFQQENQDQFYCFDFNLYLAQLGAARSFNYKSYYNTKSLFGNDFLSLYARDIATLVRALKGKTKKCLVLDCDNTMWGGIIGEDGMDGIKLDPNEYPGNIFYEFQRSVLALHNKGVLIALCSKNNEEDVFKVLDENENCLIKREHIAAHRVNWIDKASNILSLQKELNIGIDSFVFVDDNPSECELVRQAIPEVEVIQVPEKIHEYPDILLKTGWFDGLKVSDEDKKRTQLYQEESLRQDQAKQFTDLSEFYRSLNIEVTIAEAGEPQLARVAQLTQKTNQFNLTTIRYSAADIEAMSKNPDYRIYYLAVKDRFGDLGNTGVLIAHKEKGLITIDSFLLSCRILGKNIEKAFVQYCLINLEKEFGKSDFKASFIPTRKNRQTENFWEQNGFNLAEESEGTKTYKLQGVHKELLSEYDYIKIN